MSGQNIVAFRNSVRSQNSLGCALEQNMLALLMEVDRTLPAFGTRLKRLRRARSVKQFALADILSVEQSTVSRWEAGTHIPDEGLQHKALQALLQTSSDDSALRRLVETSQTATHLIDDASHICLAFSPSRGKEWRYDPAVLQGRQLWGYASDEIRAAETAMADNGWWDQHLPSPVVLTTSAKSHPEMAIKAGELIYERLYLADGTPVRLCTSRY